MWQVMHRSGSTLNIPPEILFASWLQNNWNPLRLRGLFTATALYIEFMAKCILHIAHTGILCHCVTVARHNKLLDIGDLTV